MLFRRGQFRNVYKRLPDCPTMELERTVRETVDRWYERLGAPLAGESCAAIVQPMCYGMGIMVVENGLGKSDEPNDRFRNEYLSSPFDQAVKQFRRDYLVLRLMQHDFSAVDTAEAIELGKDPRAGASMMARALAEYGMSVREMKATPQKHINGTIYKARGSIDQDSTREQAAADIRTFSGFTGHSRLRAFLRDQAVPLARELTDVIVVLAPHHLNRLYSLPYDRNFSEFKQWYLQEQLIRCRGDYQMMSKVSGKTVNAITKLMKSHSVEVEEIQRSMTTAQP